MLLRNAIGELVKLVDEVADIDTTHGICLRKWHGLREALPVKVSSREGNANRECGLRTLPVTLLLPLQANIRQQPDRILLDHSPSSADYHLLKRSEHSLAKIGSIISQMTHLIEVRAELPQQQFRVSLKQRNEQTVKLSDIVPVSLP